MSALDDINAPVPATLRFCAEACRPYRGYLYFSWACVIAGVLIGDVATPLVFAEALERITELKADSSLWGTFGSLVIIYAVLLLASTVAWRLAGWFQWEGSLKSFCNSVMIAFERLMGLGYRWHIDHPSGEVSSRLSTFAWALMEAIDQFSWGLLRITTAVFAAVIVLLVVAWPVGVTVGVFVALFVTLMVIRAKPVAAASAAFSAAHTEAEGVAFDVIRNVTTVMTQASQQLEREAVSEKLRASINADLHGRRVFAITRTWMSMILNTMTWGALFVGVVLALRHEVSAGVVYLILYYTAQIASQVIESFEVTRSLSRCLGRATKFVGLISSEPEVVDATGAGLLKVSGGEIEFRDVNFAYTPAQPLIENLQLTIAAGQRVGVVGPSGGGKSTLTRLLLRFMDVTGGEILIDGHNLAAVTQDSLRRQIAYVPQDPQMLHRTIAQNIWLGHEGEPDMRRIIEVSKAAHVHEFVTGLTDGYETIVGERGLKLSGGQRQRVAIAQAMLKGAPILVLDEATSALDSASERLVQEALWSLMSRCTSLVVAHRLSTISQLDRIVVVENGAITDSGTHAELLDHRGTYFELWQHQSGGFIE